MAPAPGRQQFPAELSVTPVRLREGYVVNVFLRDISERRRAEEASRQLAAIVESSDDAIISKDLNGIITSWNQAAERLFGYTLEEAVGKPVTILISTERHDEEPTILQRIRRGSAWTIMSGAPAQGRQPGGDFAYSFADQKTRKGRSPALQRSRATSPTGSERSERCGRQRELARSNEELEIESGSGRRS